ncbi:hypothetical protein GCM10025873_28330 [Demequina sediminis]|nr:hypothetical protein GCM10025873_00540 [Demequina sediminis]BDZ63042.1 hypothetical protein GCM10025873_28330 [Demequina sediminis]
MRAVEEVRDVEPRHGGGHAAQRVVTTDREEHVAGLGLGVTSAAQRFLVPAARELSRGLSRHREGVEREVGREWQGARRDPSRPSHRLGVAVARDELVAHEEDVSHRANARRTRSVCSAA